MEIKRELGVDFQILRIIKKAVEAQSLSKKFSCDSERQDWIICQEADMLAKNLRAKKYPCELVSVSFDGKYEIDERIGPKILNVLSAYILVLPASRQEMTIFTVSQKAVEILDLLGISYDKK